MAQRSRARLDDPDDPGMTAIHVGQCLNDRRVLEGHQSGKPIIGLAQTGSVRGPCKRPHLELAKRMHEGSVAAAGICFKLPVRPIHQTGTRRTAARVRARFRLVESLYRDAPDPEVLTIGCDRTTPAMYIGAATVGIPARALSALQVLTGWHKGQRADPARRNRPGRQGHGSGSGGETSVYRAERTSP